MGLDPMASPALSAVDDLPSDVTFDDISCAASSTCYSRTNGSTPPLSLAGSNPDTEMSRFTEDEEEPREATPGKTQSTAYHTRGFSLERNAYRLLGTDHLYAILRDPAFLAQFTTYLKSHTSHGLDTLMGYLQYDDSLHMVDSGAVDGIGKRDLNVHSESPLTQRESFASLQDLKRDADSAFDVLAREYLPAYVANIFHNASVTLHTEILDEFRADQLANRHRLAAMFCLTDPLDADRGIAFASKEYCRTTQYALESMLGRNPQFLQGPMTDVRAISRLSKAIRDREWHTELLVNYKQDGTPFLNLLTMGPLCDNTGQLRYYLGAQLDVTSSFDKNWEQRLQIIPSDAGRTCSTPTKAGLRSQTVTHSHAASRSSKSSLLSVPTTFSAMRRKAAPKLTMKPISSRSGSMEEARSGTSSKSPPPSALYSESLSRKTASLSTSQSLGIGGLGIYQRYLVLRPQSPFRILFASPILESQSAALIQTPFLSHISGDKAVSTEFEDALERGRKVTARVQWSSDVDGSPNGNRSLRGEEEDLIPYTECWAHCTPLMGPADKVGAWVVLLLDDSHGAASAASVVNPD